jgi:hypothetical protein
VTLGMGWVREVGQTREFVAAIDNRLSGGQAWDCCPKLLILPRSDCVLAFAGDTHDAYPLMLQIQNAINMYPKTRDRTIDIVHLKGHMSRVFRHMREFINNLPRGQEEPSPLDVSFLFGGYSWRDKDFRFWKLRGDEQRFVAEPPHHWGPEKNRLRIQFVGDQMVVVEAKKQLAKKMRQKGKLPDGNFDMEPFEVLRDLIRSNQFPSVGGAPQLIKVYEHMNVLPFGLYWPDRKSGKVAALGRPLMDYEISSWPVLDPDDIQFKPDDAATHVQLR